jgi:Trypsin
MRLEAPFSPDDPVQPIPINKDPAYPIPGQTLKVFGVGITETEQRASGLLEAKVKYISNDECFGRGFGFGNVAQTPDVLCADPIAGSSVCSGDSGGPLTNEEGTVLVAVTSFGSGCIADIVPDGYVRMSSVADWVQEKVCLLSRVPPADCPPRPPRDPSAVDMAMLFQHDFWSEETTWAIRSMPTREVVYSGPTYVPNRLDGWREEFSLIPGQYRIEVSDTEGNGLQGDGLGDGQWELVALYDGVTDTAVASGGPEFTSVQVVDFQVESISSVNPTLTRCLELAEEEKALGVAYSTTCDCVPDDTNEILLSCKDRNGACAANYVSCRTDTDCCSGRRCRNGTCRRVSDRENKSSSRLGGVSGAGGAAGRNRHSGGLRRLSGQKRVLRGS